MHKGHVCWGIVDLLVVETTNDSVRHSYFVPIWVVRIVNYFIGFQELLCYCDHPLNQQGICNVPHLVPSKIWISMHAQYLPSSQGCDTMTLGMLYGFETMAGGGKPLHINCLLF